MYPGRVERLFLIRHGESVANVDASIHLTRPDHAIGLSEQGEDQARRAGAFLGEYLGTLPVIGSPTAYVRPRMWVSPFLRTRQTAACILSTVGRVGFPVQYEDDAPPIPQFPRLRDQRESIALCEQDFGLFDGIPHEELPVRFPNEYALYAKQLQFEGRFWAKYPQGESRWDVALRVHQVFGTWQRDAERHNICDLVVVSHGVTLRALTMRWLDHPYEWFDLEPNPKNCSIRLIEGQTDRGYIYEGG